LISVLIFSTESGLIRVESPFGSSLISNAFRIRLMILPDLVFGKSSMKKILFGLAVGPIFLSTYFISVFSSSGEAVAFFRTTKAIGTWPFNLSGIETTATFPTCWLSWIAFSSSAVASRCPATFITSSVRPVILISPFCR